MPSDEIQSFDCDTYLKAWSAGTRIDQVTRHIDHCDFCHAVIEGEVETGVDKKKWCEQRDLRTDRRQRSRRRFVAMSIASLAMVSTIGLTTVLQSSTAGRAPFGTNTDKIFEGDLRGWDRFQAKFGDTQITKRLRFGTMKEAKDILDWIVDRGKGQFVGLLIESTQDVRTSVRTTAFRTLQKVNLRQARDFIQEIDKAIILEPIPVLKTRLSKFRQRVLDGR
ncbi:MAG: hypothetical protein V3W41_14370 [Planctomycetota bacterium]